MTQFHPHRDDCVFCREISGSRDTNFSRIYPDIKSRFIHQNLSITSFPCIGQISNGHFLIIPNDHHLSFREALTYDDTTAAQIDSTNSHTHKILNSNPDDSFYFEHAAIETQNGGCGIYHAHIHAIPKAGHINIKVPLLDAEKKSVHDTLIEAIILAPKDRPYSIYGSRKNKFTLATLTTPLPSQTLRRAVASALANESWDWRQAGRESSIIKLDKQGIFA